MRPSNDVVTLNIMYHAGESRRGQQHSLPRPAHPTNAEACRLTLSCLHLAPLMSFRTPRTFGRSCTARSSALSRVLLGVKARVLTFIGSAGLCIATAMVAGDGAGAKKLDLSQEVPLFPDSLPSVTAGSSEPAAWTGDILAIGIFEDDLDTSGNACWRSAGVSRWHAICGMYQKVVRLDAGTTVGCIPAQLDAIAQAMLPRLRQTVSSPSWMRRWRGSSQSSLQRQTSRPSRCGALALPAGPACLPVWLTSSFHRGKHT